MTVFYVALGGAIGAVLRFLVSVAFAFPFGTLTVNVVGSFAIGFLYVALPFRELDRMIPFAMIGILGGFTTFSTFSLDTLKLIEAGRLLQAGGYVAASVLLSLVAVFAAFWLAKGLLG